MSPEPLKKKRPDLPVLRRDYKSWSFSGKTFLLALTMSLLWHFFWFFSITITVSHPHKSKKIRPRMVSLGPVLDDRIFRTLVRTRPQLSQTFYRGVSDFSPPMELPVKTMDRRLPGDVVSVPLGMGKRFFSSLRDLIGGTKLSPDYEFTSRAKTMRTEESFELEGQIKDRKILSRPEPPSASTGIQGSLAAAKLELEISVDSFGVVRDIGIAVSSGNVKTDLFWVNYFKQWKFAPVPADAGAPDREAAIQKGTVRVYLDPSERS